MPLITKPQQQQANKSNDNQDNNSNEESQSIDNKQVIENNNNNNNNNNSNNQSPAPAQTSASTATVPSPTAVSTSNKRQQEREDRKEKKKKDSTWQPPRGPGVQRHTTVTMYVVQDKPAELDRDLTDGTIGINDFTYPPADSGMPLLHLAVTTNKLEVLKVLLKHGGAEAANCKEKNCDYSALFFCVLTRNQPRYEAAKMLLEAGADINHKDKFGGSCVDRCIQGGNDSNEMMELLTKYAFENKNVASSSSSSSGQPDDSASASASSSATASVTAASAASAAAGGGGGEEQQRQPTRKTSQLVDKNQFLAAICQGNLAMLAQYAPLVDAEFLNAPHMHGMNYLHYAASSVTGPDKSVEVAKWLLDRGANVNSRGQRGETPLHSAILSCAFPVANVLLDKGADLSMKAYSNQTPYDLAKSAYQGGEFITSVLSRLTAGAVTKPAEVHGFLLNTAVPTGNVRLIKVLHDCQVIDAELLKTPLKEFGNVVLLHRAVELGQLDVVKLFIELGANIDQQNIVGNTPLHVAIKLCKTENQIPLITFLVDQFANLEIRNAEGETAIDASIRSRKKDIIVAMERAWKAFVSSGRASSTGSGDTSQNSAGSGGSSFSNLSSNPFETNNTSGNGSNNNSSGSTFPPSSVKPVITAAASGNMISQLSQAIQLETQLPWLSRFPRTAIYDVDDLTMMNCVGSGGAGACFLAKVQSRGDQIVVAKRHTDPTTLLKAVAEAELSLKLHHRNVIHTYGICVNPTKFSTELFTLMEPGELSLHDVLTSPSFHAISWDTLMDYSKQMCTGLAYLHGRKICHADVKPHNILLLDNRSRLAWIDFGISRVANDSTETDMTRAGVGSCRYMARSRFSTTKIGPRDDTYALGVILAWFVMGLEPFKGSSVTEMMSRDLITDVLVEGAAREDCPMELYNLCVACLQPEAAKRPKTGKDCLAFLIKNDEEMPATNSNSVMGSDEGEENVASAAAAGDVTEQIDFDEGDWDDM